MGKILIIDDDEGFVTRMTDYIRSSYSCLQVQTCTNPLKALSVLDKSLDLVLIDLEMPSLDGMKILKFAIEAGIDKNRIVIISGRDADYLHQHFPMGSCLAVLNKYEANQQAVLDMIFLSLERKTQANH